MDDLQKARMDIEWVTLGGLRDVIGIARKGQGQTSYKQALALGEKLSPSLFDPKNRVIRGVQESAGAREYRDRAEARSEIEEKK